MWTRAWLLLTDSLTAALSRLPALLGGERGLILHAQATEGAAARSSGSHRGLWGLRSACGGRGLAGVVRLRSAAGNPGRGPSALSVGVAAAAGPAGGLAGAGGAGAGRSLETGGGAGCAGPLQQLGSSGPVAGQQPQ